MYSTHMEISREFEVVSRKRTDVTGWLIDHLPVIYEFEVNTPAIHPTIYTGSQVPQILNSSFPNFQFNVFNNAGINSGSASGANGSFSLFAQNNPFSKKF